MEIERARHEVSQSSAGGAPFLMTFGATLLACALLSFVLTTEQAALAVMFQGGVALPIAFWLERRLAFEHFAQVLAADVLLGDEVDAAVATDFVNLHDVRVDERRRGAGFLEKPGHVRCVAGQRGLEDLERDAAPQRLLLGEVDLGHAASAQAPQDAVIA